MLYSHLVLQDATVGFISIVLSTPNLFQYKSADILLSYFLRSSTDATRSCDISIWKRALEITSQRGRAVVGPLVSSKLLRVKPKGMVAAMATAALPSAEFHASLGLHILANFSAYFLHRLQSDKSIDIDLSDRSEELQNSRKATDSQLNLNRIYKLLSPVMSEWVCAVSRVFDDIPLVSLVRSMEFGGDEAVLGVTRSSLVAASEEEEEEAQAEAAIYDTVAGGGGVKRLEVRIRLVQARIAAAEHDQWWSLREQWAALRNVLRIVTHENLLTSMLAAALDDLNACGDTSRDTEADGLLNIASTASCSMDVDLDVDEVVGPNEDKVAPWELGRKEAKLRDDGSIVLSSRQDEVANLVSICCRILMASGGAQSISGRAESIESHSSQGSAEWSIVSLLTSMAFPQQQKQEPLL